MGWTIYRDRFRDHLVRFCGKASGADGPKLTSRERGWGRAKLKPSQPPTAGLGVLSLFFEKRRGEGGTHFKLNYDAALTEWRSWVTS